MSEELNNALIIGDNVNLPVQMGSDSDYDSLTQSTEFLGRLQLYSKGSAINKKLIGIGEFGIPLSKDEIISLGETCDLLPLARRPKAIDMSDTEAIITNYDPQSDEFKRIAAAAAGKDSGCMYGVSFLVVERTTQRFLEFFCGTKSTRPEAGKIYGFLPKSQAQCDQLRAEAERRGQKPDESQLVPHGPKPLSLKSKLVEKGSFSWHVPVVLPCSTEFSSLPPTEKIIDEINKFLTAKDGGVEKVEEPADNKSNRRR